MQSDIIGSTCSRALSHAIYPICLLSVLCLSLPCRLTSCSISVVLISSIGSLHPVCCHCSLPCTPVVVERSLPMANIAFRPFSQILAATGNNLAVALRVILCGICGGWLLAEPDCHLPVCGHWATRSALLVAMAGASAGSTACCCCSVNFKVSFPWHSSHITLSSMLQSQSSMVWLIQPADHDVIKAKAYAIRMPRMSFGTCIYHIISVHLHGVNRERAMPCWQQFWLDEGEYEGLDCPRMSSVACNESICCCSVEWLRRLVYCCQQFLKMCALRRFL